MNWLKKIKILFIIQCEGDANNIYLLKMNPDFRKNQRFIVKKIQIQEKEED